jgi:hypothetical protein
VRAEGGAFERPATRLLALVAEASASGTRLRLHTDGAPGRVEVFALEDPPRLVIDLLDLRKLETPPRVPVEGLGIAQLRVGRHPDKIRVVADAAASLSGLVPVATIRRDDGVVVEIGFPAEVGALERIVALPSDAPTRRGGADPAAPAPQAGAARSVDRPGVVHLELEASRRRVGGPILAGLSAPRTWRAALDLDPSGTSSGSRAEGRRLATLGESAPGTLAHDRIRAGLFDDRIRLVTQYARSHRDPAASAAATRESLHEGDLNRLRAPEGAVGEAFSGSLEGTLWEWGSGRFDSFASYGSVDPLFEWAAKGKKDPFGGSNRQTLEAGARIRNGPFRLTLARIAEQAGVEDPRLDHRPKRLSHRVVLGASLDPLRQLAAGASDSGPWSLAPTSAWLSVAQGRVEADASRPDGAATRDLGAGLAWTGESSSATLGIWRSTYASGGAASEWSGSGTDFDYGIDGERWSLHAGLGAQRYLTDQPGYRSIESSLAGFVSLSVRPGEGFPALSSSLYVDRYRAGYGATVAPFGTESWGFRTGLDFSEPFLSMLLPIQHGSRPHLRASYGALWSRSHRGLADEEIGLDHGPIVSLAFDF